VRREENRRNKKDILFKSKKAPWSPQEKKGNPQGERELGSGVTLRGKTKKLARRRRPQS